MLLFTACLCLPPISQCYLGFYRASLSGVPPGVLTSFSAVPQPKFMCSGLLSPQPGSVSSHLPSTLSCKLVGVTSPPTTLCSFSLLLWVYTLNKCHYCHFVRTQGTEEIKTCPFVSFDWKSSLPEDIFFIEFWREEGGGRERERWRERERDTHTHTLM